MNILALQLDIAWEDKAANFAKVRRLLAAAKPAPQTLVVLPELFAIGFSLNTEATAETSPGETELFLAATAREFGVGVVAGAAVRGADGRVRNNALAFSSTGERLAAYAKMRPFTLGGEARHFTAGEQPTTFVWCGATVAPFVCYDLRFPEIFRAVTAAHRPQLFTVIANWPQKRIHHWVRLLQARAIENQAYVVGVNRCGRDPDHIYNGRSLVIDYHGGILADAGDGERAVCQELDLAALENYRREVPFLDDLRAMTIGG